MDAFRVAQILRPHGIKGEVKVFPLTDDLSRFKKLREAYIERNGRYEPITVEGSKRAAEAIVLKIAGVDDPEKAEKLRGLYIAVDREHAVKLPEGTYFVSDLIGCSVFSSDGEELGKLSDVYETNANDVYVVTGRRKLSVPALKKLLDEVNTAERRIVFNAKVLSEVGLFED